MRIPQKNTYASAHLDFTRGLAALAVVYSHARVLFMVSCPPQTSLGHRLMYIASGYGHTAVIVFFVLSGFLIGGSVMNQSKLDRWSWKQYALSRGTRLYLVLIPGLLLTIALDHATIQLTQGLIPNHDTSDAIISLSSLAKSLSIQNWFYNASFLQTIKAPPLGSNTALWSLANEFWYYAIFPLLFLATLKNTKPMLRIFYASSGLLLLCFVGKSIAILFPLWLMGALLYRIPPSKIVRAHPKEALSFALVPFLVSLALIGIKLSPGTFPQYLAGVSFVPLLYVILHSDQLNVHRRYGAIASYISNCSFSLYILHLPFLVLLRSMLTYEQAWDASAWNWIRLILICLASLFLAHCFALQTEYRTGAIRRWLANFLEISLKRNSCPSS